ncbi:MAG: VWA domain-containing protein, partial [Armatimonadetes bacterium]|nr:VWA domain-containing protein [Armatimonadota bacterium]
GRRAALLEKERDDVFTASVGNLPPGEEVKLVIKWSERLPFFEDGTTEVRLPMVVAPRYIPGIALDRAGVGTGIEEDTDAVPDASRITPPRLAPGLDPKVSLSIAVEVLGGGLEDMRCSQHATRLSVGQDAVKISLARENERLNRDFVLRWRLAEDRLTTRLVASEEDGAAYGMLSLIPPARDGFLGVARDVVFVVDRSGSMSGPKMGSAARACDLLLSSLTPGDRFAVQAFDDQYEWLEDNGQRFFHADEAGLEKGQKYLRGIDARGGTELDGAMHQAIAAIAGRVSEEIRTPVIVLLTDGQIGDESRVLQRIQKDLGDARVFTVGIDTAVNEAFLKRLASLGGGTSAFVAPGEALEEALRVVAREIGTPLVVDIKVADVDAGVEVVAPQPIPDLFAGRAASVYLKMARPGRVRVTGTRTDGGAFDVTVAATRVEVPALAQLWAKARVADLEDRFRLHTGNESDLKREIIEIAVKHSLLTRFTAFVVVDREEIVNPTGRTRQVTQAVEMPDQWEMELGAPAPMQAFAAPPGMAMPAPMLAMAPGPCLPPPLARAKRASKQVVGGFAKRKQEAEADASAAPPEPAPPAGRMGPVPGFAGGGGAAKPGMAPPSPPPSLAEAPPAREEAKPADVADVHAALDAFAKALEAARKALSEGTVPPVAQLEQA